MSTLRLITANEGRHINVQQTRADFEDIRRLRGITGFQEIDEADTAPEHGLLRAVLGDTHNLYGMEHLVPIAVPKGWQVVNSREVLGTGGVEHYSPARYFTIITVKNKLTATDRILRRNQKIFVVINCHYPAGAYHGDRPPAATRELRRHWDEQFRKHKEIVKSYVDRGITVFNTSDSNRVEMPKTHPREVQVVKAGIDNICYIEGGVKVKVLKQGMQKQHSDHPAFWVDFKLS